MVYRWGQQGDRTSDDIDSCGITVCTQYVFCKSANDIEERNKLVYVSAYFCEL